MIDTSPGADPVAGTVPGHHRRCRTQLRRAVVQRRHRQVQQRRRDQDRTARRHRATEPIRRRCSDSGRRCRPIFRARARASCGVRRSGRESALASVSMGYQVGVTPLQMVAAVSAVANGGELVEPRVVRAVYRDNRRYAVEPKVIRRTISADTAATLTDDHGRRRRRRSRHREGGADRRLHHRRQDRHGAEAGQRPLLDVRTTTRRSSASSRRGIRCVAMIVVIDAAKGPTDHGGYVAAPIFKRIAEPALRYLGVPRSVDPEAAGAGRAQRRATCRPRSATPSRRRSSAWWPTTPPGTVPDLRGLSAREATHEARQAGVDRPDVGRRLRRVTGSAARHAARVGERLPPDSRPIAGAVCWRAPSHDVGRSVRRAARTRADHAPAPASARTGGRHS